MSALCVALMAMARVISIVDYAVSGICGVIIGVAVIELGNRWALACYAVSSMLGMIVGANEAALVFVVLFGYYPIIKPYLERLKKPIAYAVKALLFNGIVCTLYYLLDRLGFIPMEEISWLGNYTAIALLGLANIEFFAYDYAFNFVMTLYYVRLHPQVVKTIKK